MLQGHSGFDLMKRNQIILFEPFIKGFIGIINLVEWVKLKDKQSKIFVSN